MKIRLLGLDFQPGPGISLGELFADMAARQGSAIHFQGYERLLYVEEVRDYYVGLLITTKDQKKFLELTQHADTVKITARDVTAGAQLADFNFFLFHKQTGRGIYQYYHNSCALNPFGLLCKKYYDDLRHAAIAREIDALAVSMRDARVSAIERARGKIRKKYQTSLKWLQIIRPEAFDALIRDLQKINSFSITMSTLSQEEPLFRPLALQARKVVHEFKFSDDGVVDTIKNGIRNTLAKVAPTAAKVVGVDHHGMEQIIKLANNPDSFGEFEYDEVAGRMNFNPREFAHSWFMNQIIKVVEAKPALFMAQIID
jgi:hypothetical protein